MKGIYTALITPFKQNGKVDYANFVWLINYQNESSVDGIVLFGSTGEEKMLTTCEKIKLLRIACDVVKNKEIYVGISEINTKNAIFEIKKYENFNINGFLISPPFYVKPNQEQIYKFYSEIAKSTDKNICLYNIPSRTGAFISVSTVLKLAENNNIVALKDATGDLNYAKEINKWKKPGFSVLCGNDNLFFKMKRLGSDGGVCVFSNFLPNFFQQGSNYVQNKEILRLFHRVNGLPNPAGIKKIMFEHSLIQNVLRPPLC